VRRRPPLSCPLFPSTTLFRSQPVIAFFDDDILFEPGCIARLWHALQSDPRIGGVNAMITNQRYQTPGLVSRTLLRIMAGREHDRLEKHTAEIQSRFAILWRLL